MTETNTQPEQQQETQPSSLDGFFNQVDFGEQKEDKTSDETEVEDTPTEETQEVNTDGEQDGGDEPTELDLLKEELSTLEKRFKDTQKWGNERNKQLASLVEQAKENEWLSEDEISNLKVDVPETDQAKLAARLNEELPTAIAVAAEVTGKDKEELNKHVEAFTSLVDFDPNIFNELQSLPANQQAAYVLKKGSELSEVYDKAVEAGGLLNLAVQNLKGSDSKVKKAIKEVEERVTRELEEKYAEYVSPVSKSRPKLHGGSSVSKTNQVSGDDVMKDTFNALFRK